jgi:hypothetical protein
MKKPKLRPITCHGDQLAWPFSPNGHRERLVDGRRLVIPFFSRTGIPAPAAQYIFEAVFAQYLAIRESEPSDVSIEARDFVIDVETQIQRLYGQGEDYRRAHQLLMNSPRSLKTTRAALGEGFVLSGLWPVRNYFANGK